MPTAFTYNPSVQVLDFEDIGAFSSSLTASYAVSVRWASALPSASFRFPLAVDPLAVRLTIPPVGFVGDFHSLVRAPCRAHQPKETGSFTPPVSSLVMRISLVVSRTGGAHRHSGAGSQFKIVTTLNIN